MLWIKYFTAFTISQNIQRNKNLVLALLGFGTCQLFPCPSGLLHQQWEKRQWSNHEEYGHIYHLRMYDIATTTIIWANIDSDLCPHMASLGHESIDFTYNEYFGILPFWRICLHGFGIYIANISEIPQCCTKPSMGYAFSWQSQSTSAVMSVYIWPSYISG